MSKHDKYRTSRRHFLRTSSAITAAGAMAGSLGIARGAHAAGDDVLKVGLIGCGGRGTGAAVNALNADKNNKLTAMADVFDDRLNSSRERLKKLKPEQVAVDDDHCFVGFDAYRKLIDSGVDVVLIACPSHFHSIHLKAAVDAGKHVFVEKPHAVDAPGVRTVMASCEEAKKKGLSIVSGLCRRYHPGIRETIKRIHDGAIGDVLAIQATGLGGFTWHRGHKPEWTEMEFQLRNWCYFTWLSGDFLVEGNIHDLDVAAWIMHDEPPLKAWGMGGRQVRTEQPKYGDTSDHFAIVYEYANGVRLYDYWRHHGGCYNEWDEIATGAKGRCSSVLKHRIEGEAKWRYDGPKCNMWQIEHDKLFDSIRSGKPINNGLYMARSTMMAILGRMVTYTGQSITWEDALNSKQDLSLERYALDAEPPAKPSADGKYPIAIPGVTKFV